MNQMVTYFASDVETIDLVRHESIVSFLLNKDHLRGYCNEIFISVNGFLPSKREGFGTLPLIL